MLRRFRELLKTQRDRFRQYLEVLEKQQNLIEGEWAASTGDELEAHVNLESRIVADIFSIQKVIDPLERMLDVSYPAGKRPGRRARPKKDEAAGDLKTSLENLRGEAAALLERNRALLSKKMEKVQEEIKILAKNPYRKGRSVYGETPAPTLIDIEG
ncbi:MAG: flagellar biosynthesis protein FlgN [Spirochaetaceae bacterium]|nr:flagellar biosynthesis protein FlgN [Spirochaetaceae bacterium]